MTNDYSTGGAAPSAGSSPRRARAGSLKARLLWLVAVVLFSSLTCTAGEWQLYRARAKIAWQAQIAERGALPALDGGQLARNAATGEQQAQRHIALAGQWDAAHTVFLMNRTMGERAGFYVMTPLRLPEGDAVLVQRGWVAGVDGDPTHAPPVPTPAGPVALRGHVAPWPARWFELGHAANGAVRQNVERAAFSAESGLALRPVIVVEDASAANAADGMGRDWPPPTAGTSIATHYGYAVQWFGMAIAAWALYVTFQFVRPRRLARAQDDDASSR